MALPARALLACLLLGAPVASAAQQPDWDPGRVLVTREDLQNLLQRLEQAATSPTYSQPVRDRARADAALLRTRLTEGDFQVGDRILLVVEGEQALSDTFAVRDGRVLRLPTIGDVALAGVLRSELEPHLLATMAKFLRNPVVRARSLIRLSMLGEVARPGFYVVPTDMVITDALMLAGGPTPTARLQKLRIERGSELVWSEAPLQEAIAAGRTVEQLNLRAGDQVVVPRRGTGFFNESTLRTISILLAIPAAIYGLTQLF